MGTFNFRELPRLAAYIARIGAEPSTLLSFAVKEQQQGYPRQVCKIRLRQDGTILVTGERGKDFKPSKDEIEAIKAELAKVDFPKSITASEAQFDKLRKMLSRKGVADADLFICPDRQAKGLGIAMVQQRIERDNGSKDFRPWTLWSDGDWHCMEPDGGLPFWKPIKSRFKKGQRPSIMIHEGPKSAAFVDRLVNDPYQAEALAQNPFGAVLARYEHWGILGGAFRGDDARWAEVHAAKPKEVLYVCDNDHPGKNALPIVSRAYGGPLKGVVFDKNWPEGWDLADEMPADLFAKSTGNYIGPQWHSLLHFATWATRTVFTGDRGRPSFKIRPEFTQEWVHAVKPEIFIHRDWPDEFLTAQEFNNAVRPYSDVDDTARLVKTDAATKAAILSYRPTQPHGIFSDADGGNYFNTHIGSSITPVKGDVAPFIEFLQHLVPDPEERLEVERWCATLIGRPDIKIRYGLLLISEVQGIGKGTLAEKILTPLVGIKNMSSPSESEIVDSNYNYWASHKRLAVVHEIYAGQSSKAYNKLKSIITDKFITVQKKFQAHYEIENFIHVLACSNSKRALRLSMDDRRWLVPRLAETKWPASAHNRFKRAADYWAWFNAWLVEDEGLGKILHWAHEWLKQNEPALTDAPWSEHKKEVVEEGYSDGMQLVADWLDSLKVDGKKVVVTDNACVDLIKNRLHEGRHNSRLEKPSTVRRVAVARGWTVGGQRVSVAVGRLKAKLLATDAALLGHTPDALRKMEGVEFIDQPPL
jgi:hypothetical protein